MGPCRIARPRVNALLLWRLSHLDTRGAITDPGKATARPRRGFLSLVWLARPPDNGPATPMATVDALSRLSPMARANSAENYDFAPQRVTSHCESKTDSGLGEKSGQRLGR
jgi:hypothetical protein